MPQTGALRRAYVWLEGAGRKTYIYEEKRDIQRGYGTAGRGGH